MITGFEVGKRYRFIGDEKRLIGWTAEMYTLCDGVARECIKRDWDGLIEQQSKMSASFKGVPDNGGRCWDFSGDESNFEEVTA